MNAVEWHPEMHPDEMRAEADKADRIAAEMEAEARRFRAIAAMLREKADRAAAS